MSKLITAKEAFALSSPIGELERHISYINYQIQFACEHGFHAVEVRLTDCTIKTLREVVVILEEAGYCVSWDKSHSRAWVYIGWGGS